MHRLGPDPSEKSGRVSLPPWSTLPTESTSTPTRSSVGPPASASQSSAGSSSVIQLLQQELAGLQAEVQAKKRGTQPQVPSTSFASAFAAAPIVPPSFPSSRGPYSNDTDLLGLMGAGPALSNSGAWGETTPQNSSGQLMLNLPPTATSAAPNESILVLQQQLRQLQLMAAEKGNSAVGGSERGQRRRPAPFVSSPSPPLAASSSQRFVVGSERGERRGTEGLSSSIDLL